jgi:hypothetical protein
MLVGRQPQTAIDWRKIAIARDDHGQTVLSLLATASDLQLVILTLKFRLEVLFASSRFADSGVFACGCGSSSLPGTG